MREIQKPDLPEKLKHLPDSPGVYILKATDGKILYVGKAKSLKKRIRAYFTDSRDVKTRHLQARIGDLELFPTGSEAEALLLENNLIKRWKPKYNINLKDGKTYPVIRLTNEEYPRVFRTRRIIFDGSKYYGPFPKVGHIDLYLNIIDKIFPLRKCRGQVKEKKQPCFYFHIGRCPGVCAGKISREEYQQRVQRVKMLLAGRTEELARELRQKMKQASDQQEYEKASVFRDQLEALHSLSEEQKVVDFQSEARDYLGYWSGEDRVRLTVLQLRAGKLIGRDSMLLENYSIEEEFLPAFLGQYYGGRTHLPRMLYLPAALESIQSGQLLGSYLKEITGSRITVSFPKKGRHARLVAMAAENARFRLEAEGERKKQALANLQEILHLKRPPRRIEGFDIAHLAGKQTVASLVTFLDGRPQKSGYRHYHIRSLNGRIDDFEAIREVVARRYARQLNERSKLPDLILIDGGKGQVSSAVSMLKALEGPRIPVVGLAKKQEELFLPEQGNPLILPEGSEALRMLQAVRDEAHRFATTFHKRVRATELNTSVLESVRGIGKKRSKALLTAFGSLAEIRRQQPEAIATAASCSLQQARELLTYLSKLES
ncbi:MAG: excinuclease ABC subunit UvrC [Spirochaetaceae bacterium]|nr:MAG: excinuclease ABC subunit UvrC [Spirochaetaceae bacterium]